VVALLELWDAASTRCGNPTAPSANSNPKIHAFIVDDNISLDDYRVYNLFNVRW